MADYVDYRRALNYRAIDVRASVPSASDVRPDPALWWEGAVVVRAAVAHYGRALEHASEELRGSKPIVLAVVTANCPRRNSTNYGRPISKPCLVTR